MREQFRDALQRAYQIRGTALGKTWRAILFFSSWGGVVVLLEELGLLPGHISAVPFTFIGLPIGFFLAFRGNQGYARFWEARQHWATVGNTVRNVARQASVYLQHAEAPAGVLALKRLLIAELNAYVSALRAQLVDNGLSTHTRDQLVRAGQDAALDPSLPRLGEATTINAPYALLRTMLGQLDWAYRAGWLDRLFVRHMDAQLSLLSDASGACLKIHDTPVPASLVLLIKRMLWTYLFFLPIGIVDTTGWFAPIVVAVVAFAFLGLDSIAGELSTPFTEGSNQLPLGPTSEALERDLQEILHELDASARERAENPGLALAPTESRT